MYTVYVCTTVKIQFDNTSTSKYSIILALRSVAMLPRAFGPSIFENSGPALASGLLLNFTFIPPTNKCHSVVG